MRIDGLFGLKQKKQRLHIHIEDAIEICFGLVYRQRVIAGCRGIVKSEIKASEGFEHERHDQSDLIRLTQVSLEERGTSDITFDFIDLRAGGVP